MSPSRRCLLIILGVVLGFTAALFLILSNGPTHKSVVPPTAHKITPPTRPSVGNQSQRPFLGITEENANLLLAPGDITLPSPFASANLDLSALRPTYIRLLVDWQQLQLHEGQEPALGGTVNGCSRSVAPCLPYLWLEAELRAIKT